MSNKQTKESAELMRRYAVACEFKQAHDPERAADALRRWIIACGYAEQMTVRAATNWQDCASAASAAWAARDARAVSAASAARAVSAAWAASAARAVSAAWAARDASWFALTAIGAELLGDKTTRDRWMPLMDALDAGVWLMWIGNSEIVYAPTPIIHADGNRPHSTDGPSLESLDLRLWHINGVEVDEQIVKRPQTQTIAQIDGEPNAEVKRIRIERYGWLPYLKAKKAKVIDHRQNDIEQTDESLMRCGDMTVFIGACPSTGRIYSLEVPPDTQTCEQAQDFLNGGRSRRLVGAS